MENKKLAENENASNYIQRIRERLAKLRLNLGLTFHAKERRKLIKQVSDLEILKDVFENDQNWACKQQALVRIKDQDYLTHVASSKSFDWTFRKTAMEKIKDHDVLFEIALKERNEDLLKFLISIIKSKKRLEELKHHIIKTKIYDGKNGELLRLLKDKLSEIDNSISFIFD